LRDKYLFKFSIFITCSPGDGNDLSNFSSNAAAMWVKIISSWLCAALYTWTLVAPAILSDRDFGY
jgi:hypothetical protein